MYGNVMHFASFRSQDVLAKHCGALLDHFDLLMPYAELGHLAKPVESGWLWALNFILT